MKNLVNRDDSSVDSLIDSSDKSSIGYHLMPELTDEDSSVDSISEFYCESRSNDDNIDSFSHTSTPPTIPYHPDDASFSSIYDIIPPPVFDHHAHDVLLNDQTGLIIN